MAQTSDSLLSFGALSLDEHRDSDASTVERPTSPEIYLDLWFEDGSIVIQASRCLFRVHRTILASQSEIFNDMMGLPTTSEDTAGSTYEGVPLVVIPDNDEDFADLMTAIYKPHTFNYLRSDEVDEREVFQKISGILRLSTKYRFLNLRTWCLEVLDKISPMGKTFRPIPEDQDLDKKRTALAFEIVRLGRECNVPTIIPAALYQICRSIGMSGEKDHEVLNSLQFDDYTKAWCLSGRTRIAHLQIPKGPSYDWLGLVSREALLPCPRGERAKSKVCTGVPEPAVNWDEKDTLYALDRLAWVADSNTSGNCHRCCTKFQELYELQQTAIWEKINRETTEGFVAGIE
ncbi:hypothetical protein B0H34DRAFT_737573 [Crassisporium funariophilum]|nr:hypothetical protein B0H34DRAFT_737573 [Crassisporium funariophilum]